MYKKKFQPVITRVKLNPEQAVLVCACYSGGSNASGVIAYFGSSPSTALTCISAGKEERLLHNSSCGGAGNYNHYAVGSYASVS